MIGLAYKSGESYLINFAIGTAVSGLFIALIRIIFLIIYHVHYADSFSKK